MGYSLEMGSCAELGCCSACGRTLLMRVVSFARCSSCGAENYRPLEGAGSVEAFVARFWGRLTAVPTRRPAHA